MNIDELIGKIHRVVNRHSLGEGDYARYLWQNLQENRKMGSNEYGCADAANILYSIGEFPRDRKEREKWIETLQNMQDPDSGLYHEETHHTIHTTAHCIAALELFDARPRYPLRSLEQYLDFPTMYHFLESLDWEKDPWNSSHKGAGLYAALTITEGADLEWRRDYFSWLQNHSDTLTGIGVKRKEEKAPLCHHLFGWFHYLFNYEAARMPIPNPDKLIDSCIRMYQENGLPEYFGKNVGFMEIDWIFSMNRASRQTVHRFDEVKELLCAFAEQYIDYLNGLDEETDEGLNDLHFCFGMVCALSELQAALPGKIETKRPLKNVLDRRPFI